MLKQSPNILLYSPKEGTFFLCHPHITDDMQGHRYYLQQLIQKGNTLSESEWCGVVSSDTILQECEATNNASREFLQRLQRINHD